MLAESHITGIPQKAALTDWKKVLIPFVYFFSTKRDVGSAVSIYISNRFCISKIMKNMFVLCASTTRMLHIAFPYTCCSNDLPAQYISDLLHYFFGSVLVSFHHTDLLGFF